MPSSTLPSTLSLHDALPISAGYRPHRTGAASLDFWGASRAVQAGAACLVAVRTHRPDLWSRVVGLRWPDPRRGPGSDCRGIGDRSEEHTSELQSRFDLVCRLAPCPPRFPYTTLFRSLLGIALTGLVPLPWISGEHRVQFKPGPPAWWRSGLIGLTFGAGWSACAGPILGAVLVLTAAGSVIDRKSTRLNSSHVSISYAV